MQKRNAYFRPLPVIMILIALLLLGGAMPAAAQTLKVGAYVPGQSVTSLSTFETLVGRDQDYYMWFTGWDRDFPTALAQNVVDHGAIPHVTWEPWEATLDEIISGAKDDYIRRYANSAKSVTGTVHLRPMHEMNGNWYPWAAGENSPDKIKAAYRHIVDVFRAESAFNVKFIWAPNHVGEPDWTGQKVGLYYPGDAYVDYAGIDGYNWGTSRSWSAWNSFGDTFRPAYTAITGFTTKPIIIGESASSELGGNKGRWITETFSAMNSSYPQIHGFIWFNVNKETDWRVESSQASIDAYRSAMASLGPRVVESDGGGADPGTVVAPPAPAPAPVPALRAPAAGALLRGQIKFAAAVTNAAPTTKTQFLVDGVVRGTAYGPNPSFAWTSTAVSSGTHTVAARTFDALGNAKVAASRKIRIDNTPPSIRITNPTNYRLYQRYRGLWLVARATDANGVPRVVFTVDGVVRRVDFTSPYAWYWNIRYMKRGWHKVKISAVDRAQNWRTVTKNVYVTW